jgi:hypothetical protein
MAKSLWKNNINAKEILLILAKIGAFTVAATSPYFFHRVIKYYFKERSYKRRLEKQKMLYELKRRKYISFEQQSDETIKITLAHKGKLFVRQYHLENLRLQKPKNWDKQWRILLYDIPVHHKRASDAFREKLKQLGLYQLQKSVWVSPYDFVGEIEFLCGVFDIDINQYILYFTTHNIPKESILKKFFHLN